ncbi:MAG: hypothetical protein K6F32_05930 [Bacilli bacterium]|nr:hypothetical protein [Bacilli bacterium]
MEVKLVKPCGYCLGVTQAMKLAEKAKKDYPDRDVYLLGLLVHNEDAVKELSDLGLIVLDERKRPLEESLNNIKEGSVVVFSAHGHPERYDEIAARKGLTVLDATCCHVKENLEYARENASSGIIYIGAKGHLEAEAFHANLPCSFYDVKSRSFIDEVPLGKSPVAVSQTTLSYDEVDFAFKAIKEKYPGARLGKERCLATSSRQNALRKAIEEGIDGVFVIGSHLSSNTKKLRDIATSYGVPTFMALNEEELKKLDIPQMKKAALVSGASTDIATALRCARYLESL